MKLVSNGTSKDVTVLRHFKVGEEEYILYKNVNSISIGVIRDNKVLTPDADKIPNLMKILGNLISVTPNEAFNQENKCVLLANDITTSLEEVSFQNVNIPEANISHLISSNVEPIAAAPIQSGVVNTTSNINSQEEKKAEPEKLKNTKMMVYGIIIVVLTLVLGFLLLKDKIFSGSSSSNPSVTPEPLITPEPVAGIASCPNCVYSYYVEAKKYSGEKTVLTEYVEDYKLLLDSNGNQRTKFLGQILDSEGKIERAFACGIENGQAFCLEGFTDGSKYESNKEILNTAFGGDKCMENTTGYTCTGSIKANAYLDGNTVVLADDYECHINNTGDLSCESRSQ